MWWMSLARPKSAIFITLSSVTNTLRAARSLWMHWGDRNTRHHNRTHVLTDKASRPLACHHLLGGQVLHPPRHLESAGHQVLDGHVLHGDLVRVVAVLHPRRAPSAQVLPQVSLGGVFDDDVQRTCRVQTRNNKYCQSCSTRCEWLWKTSTLTTKVVTKRWIQEPKKAQDSVSLFSSPFLRVSCQETAVHKPVTNPILIRSAPTQTHPRRRERPPRLLRGGLVAYFWLPDATCVSVLTADSLVEAELWPELL